MLLGFILNQFGFAGPIYTIVHMGLSLIASIASFVFLTPALMASCAIAIAIATAIASLIIYMINLPENEQKNTFSPQ